MVNGDTSSKEKIFLVKAKYDVSGDRDDIVTELTKEEIEVLKAILECPFITSFSEFHSRAKLEFPYAKYSILRTETLKKLEGLNG